MPLFEFICKDCNNKFEKIVFSIDNEKIQCPNCKSENVQKQFSLFSSVNSNSQCCSSSNQCSTKKHHCCNGCCHH